MLKKGIKATLVVSAFVVAIILSVNSPVNMTDEEREAQTLWQILHTKS